MTKTIRSKCPFRLSIISFRKQLQAPTSTFEFVEGPESTNGAQKHEEDDEIIEVEHRKGNFLIFYAFQKAYKKTKKVRNKEWRIFNLKSFSKASSFLVFNNEKRLDKDSLIARLAMESTGDAASAIMEALYNAEQAAAEAARASGDLQKVFETMSFEIRNAF